MRPHQFDPPEFAVVFSVEAGHRETLNFRTELHSAVAEIILQKLGTHLAGITSWFTYLEISGKWKFNTHIHN